MALTKQTDHAGAARARLLEQYKKFTKLGQMLDILNKQTQAIEDAFWQLLVERTLDAAIGAQLDLIGAIVGQERAGALDPAYRLRIKARVKANHSSGTNPELLAMVALLVDSEATIRIEHSYPAGFRLIIDGAVVPSTDAPIIASFIAAARVDGVYATFEWTQVSDTPEEDFTFKFGLCQHVGSNIGAGVSTINTGAYASLPGVWPATGTVYLDYGTTREESVSYTSYAGGIFTLSSATTQPHDQGASIQLADGDGAFGADNYGFSDDGSIGGALAGALTA